MQEIRIEKITLNIGVGKPGPELDKAVKLLENISGQKPIQTKTSKRIPTWGIRPGLPVGCKITLRKEKGKDILPRLLYALENVLSLRNFDNYGNISFGIKEYIDIQDAKYDPKIGIIGLQVSVTLDRRGFRVKRRRMASKVHRSHLINKEEAIAFMKEKYGVKIKEEIQKEEE